MPYTVAGKNAMLAALGVTHAAVFNGDPTATGTQLGARQPISWNAPAAGVLDSSTVPEFAVDAGQTVNHVAFYTALTAGELRAYAAVTAETFANAGTYRLLDADLDLNAA